MKVPIDWMEGWKHLSRVESQAKAAVSCVSECQNPVSTMENVEKPRKMDDSVLLS